MYFAYMNTIIVIGDPGENDIQTVEAAAVAKGMNIEHLRELANQSAGRAAGYVSFLPNDLSVLTDVFASLPMGTGESIPFYQQIQEGEEKPSNSGLPISGYFSSPLTAEMATILVNSSANLYSAFHQKEELIGEIVKYRKQNRQLIDVATSLGAGEDLAALLERILSGCRELVCADAGSIYVREKDAPGGIFTRELRFKISQNDSVSMSDKAREFVLAIDTNTIAGYVAHTGKPLVIDDVYELHSSVPYRFGRDYDTRFGYRMKSMLTVPLMNLASEVVGVLQLMNKKDSWDVRLSCAAIVDAHVVPFSYSDQDIILSVAALAAVSIERIQLYDSIQTLFEGFLSSSIAAIDERDRVTSGHSRRVMGYAMAFVDAVNQCSDGPFGDVVFTPERKRQFKFAALLHDIGKIGVPESVLTKEFRLGSGDMLALMARLDYIRLFLLSDKLSNGAICWESVEELEDDRSFLRKVNQSGFLDDNDLGRLTSLREKTYDDLNGETMPVLTDEEWTRLSVRKGNLTEAERNLINSHASSTRRILSKIPWGRQLSEISEIACHHHEKMNGTGYPDGLVGDQILLESRILAVIDIYEALVAQDRPYKPAMEPSRAIEILVSEASAGHLDENVVSFFVDKKVYLTFCTDTKDT